MRTAICRFWSGSELLAISLAQRDIPLAGAIGHWDEDVDRITVDWFDERSVAEEALLTARRREPTKYLAADVRHWTDAVENSPQGDTLLTPAEVAVLTHRHRETVTLALRRGELRGRQREVGGRWTVARADAIAWALGRDDAGA